MRMAPLSRHHPCAATLLVVLGFAAGVAAAQDTGAVQTRVTRTGRLLHVTAALLAAAPANTCYEVLADFDRLEDFVPRLVSSDVLSAPGEPILLRQVGEARVAFFRASIDVTLAVRVHPPERIEFERIAGNLKQMQGGWTVTGDGQRCDIAYRADIEPAFWVPPLIGPRLMRSQIAAQMRGLLEEIEARAATADAP
jgi:ribosome-associated toxin RatA of RatAB toxin-antitoxin module